MQKSEMRGDVFFDRMILVKRGGGSADRRISLENGKK
jgi:hypothetical protein